MSVNKQQRQRYLKIITTYPSAKQFVELNKYNISKLLW